MKAGLKDCVLKEFQDKSEGMDGKHQSPGLYKNKTEVRRKSSVCNINVPFFFPLA
jgi:hypothetical protein